MNRKELIKFVNEKVSPQVGLNFSFSPVETVNGGGSEDLPTCR